MPKKVRLFSATFNDAYESWECILPASSREDFIRMYLDRPNINLDQSSIKNQNFFNVELDQRDFLPIFRVPEKNISFTPEDLGYKYLYSYFAEHVNNLKRYEVEAYEDQNQY